MALTSGNRVLAAHIAIFFEGVSYTSPSSGTCGRESKPGASDTGWIKIGAVTDFAVTHDKTEIEIMKPVPGRRVRYDMIHTDQKLDLSFTVDEMRAEMVELLFGSLALNSSSTQYNPLEGAEKRCWLKVQFYDQTSTSPVNTVDLFAILSIDGEVTANNQLHTFPVAAKVLHSTLNTGTI
jgi:hypothetical protein